MSNRLERHERWTHEPFEDRPPAAVLAIGHPVESRPVAGRKGVRKALDGAVDGRNAKVGGHAGLDGATAAHRVTKESSSPVERAGAGYLSWARRGLYRPKAPILRLVGFDLPRVAGRATSTTTKMNRRTAERTAERTVERAASVRLLLSSPVTWPPLTLERAAQLGLYLDQMFLNPVSDALNATTAVLTDPRTHRMIVRALILGTVAITAMVLALGGYASFWWVYVPQRGLRREVLLQYGYVPRL